MPLKVVPPRPGRAFYYPKTPPGFDPTMVDAAERPHEMM
jgi:hypothetical protein